MSCMIVVVLSVIKGLPHVLCSVRIIKTSCTSCIHETCPSYTVTHETRRYDILCYWSVSILDV